MSNPTVTSAARNRSTRTRAADSPPASEPLLETDNANTLRAARAKQIEQAWGISKQNPSALLWSVPDDLWSQESGPALSDRTKLLKLFAPATLSAKIISQIQTELTVWLAQPAGDARHAWEALAWQQALLANPSSFSPEARTLLLDRLQLLVSEATTLAAEEAPLTYQWLSVELPWMLGLSSDQADGVEFLRLAQRNFVHLCEACFDPEGLPAAPHLAHLSAIFASWTRCSLAGKVCNEAFIPKHELPLSLAVLRQTLRFTRPDGTSVLSASHQTLTPWISLALEFANDAEAIFLANQLLGIGEKNSVGKKNGKKGLTQVTASSISVEGKVAVLRAEPTKSATQLAVTFEDAEMRLELIRNVKLFSGAWTSELAVNGQVLEQTHEWEDVLWYEDEDAVYLEVETRFADAWRVQRQMILPRQDPFVFLADAVIGTETAKLKYTQGLPLAANVNFQPEAQTHEGWLTQGNNRRLAMPLACPEWRSERSYYQLTTQASQLQYTAEREGRCLYLPLFLFLNSVRGKLEYTWRRLTVGEQLEIQSPDVAAAARVQVGDLQWAAYRALSHKANRTFLGKNLATEFYLGRFQRDGSFTTIMEVE